MWKYTTQKQIRDQAQTSPLSKYKYERKYKCEYKYKHKVGTLHQVAYYENPGILMIVQSVEDQEGTKANQGDWSNQYQSKSILIDRAQKNQGDWYKTSKDYTIWIVVTNLRII